jgi:hypothetical protein
MEPNDPPIRYTVDSDRPGNFVIEMTHRETGDKKYIGAVPDQPDSFTNTMFDRLNDASRYPFPSEQAAAAIIVSLPTTRNIDYAVIEAKGGK